MLTDRLRAWAAPIYLVLCLVLGGASGTGAGVAANALLQALALPLILFSLWTWGDAPFSPQVRGVSWLTAMFLVVALLSIVPVPANWWQTLPGREPTAHGLTMLDLGETALPASLAPGKTAASLLWLLPPVALFLLVLRLPYGERKRLPIVLAAIAALSIALGAAQLLGGGLSPLRLYEITNPNSPVGFFANTNHYATLLLCTLPFSGYLAARAVTSRNSRSKGRGVLIVSVALAIFLLVGIATGGSLAGYALALPTAFATLLIYRRSAHGPISKRWLAVFGALFLSFLAASWLDALNQEAIGRKFSDQPSSRKVMTLTTIEAAKDYFPVGSGLGTLPDVYRSYENPDVVTSEYVNHSHNDYAEIGLELGLPGIVLVLGFVFWWGRGTLRIWRSEFQGASLARGATVAIGVILAHSLVDYPIRTSAIAAVFAMACAFFAPPAASVSVAGSRRDESTSKHMVAD